VLNIDIPEEADSPLPEKTMMFLAILPLAKSGSIPSLTTLQARR
jgi:hypothetical protein